MQYQVYNKTLRSTALAQYLKLPYEEVLANITAMFNEQSIIPALYAADPINGMPTYNLSYDQCAAVLAAYYPTEQILLFKLRWMTSKLVPPVPLTDTEAQQFIREKLALYAALKVPEHIALVEIVEYLFNDRKFDCRVMLLTSAVMNDPANRALMSISDLANLYQVDYNEMISKLIEHKLLSCETSDDDEIGDYYSYANGASLICIEQPNASDMPHNLMWVVDKVRKVIPLQLKTNNG